MADRIFGPAAREATTERGEAVELLKAHQRAGRLTEAETRDRVLAAMSAATLGDLDRLFADLPVLAGPRSAPLPEHTLGYRDALTILERRYASP